jgi:hypothetical protein
MSDSEFWDLWLGHLMQAGSSGIIPDHSMIPATVRELLCSSVNQGHNLHLVTILRDAIPRYDVSKVGDGRLTEYAHGMLGEEVVGVD